MGKLLPPTASGARLPSKSELLKKLPLTEVALSSRPLEAKVTQTPTSSSPSVLIKRSTRLDLFVLNLLRGMGHGMLRNLAFDSVWISDMLILLREQQQGIGLQCV